MSNKPWKKRKSQQISSLQALCFDWVLVDAMTCSGYYLLGILQRTSKVTRSLFEVLNYTISNVFREKITGFSHKLTVKLDWLIQHNASHLIARRDVIWVYRKCFIHDDFLWKCREINADFNWFLLSIWHNFLARWWRRVMDSVACGRHIFWHHHSHKNATDICYIEHIKWVMLPISLIAKYRVQLRVLIR